ncbi:MAG: cytochrome c3 family protein [Kofleriaceae bacterium]|nr:cytochrome c3 family protein [Kofleriaceae bacterium]MCB9572640.1 cytochrome c3 family protein [Kofleriaceae bacterium]
MTGVIAVAVAAVAAACGHDAARRDPPPTRIVLPPLLAAMPAPTATPIDPGYVGPEVCGECHEAKLASARKTSHFRTSRPATPDATTAPFGGDAEDVVVASPVDPRLRIVLLAQDGGLWQVGLDGRSQERVARKADVVFGSGKLGQTFLYWEGPFLYELPATYFAPPVGWRFSPGYHEDQLDFSRPVFGQCLECHALWAQPGRPDLVYEHSYVGEVRWGVTCEKCHGPGRDHVAWHRAHPDDTEPHAIVAPDDLSRERRDDICMLCHSDHGEELQPAFSFRPGKVLREFYSGPRPGAPPPPPDPGNGMAAMPDVHSNNQMDRLRQSACYRGSAELGCVSCHDPHTYERGDAATFNERCMACHDAATLSPTRDAAAGRAAVRHDGAAPCVDCHMPRARTEIAQRPGGEDEARAMIRDHKIGIYPAP